MKANDPNNVYSQEYRSTDGAHAELVLRKLKGGKFSLQAYLPAGMDIAPHIFVVGTIEECRANYKRAKEFMNRYFVPFAA